MRVLETARTDRNLAVPGHWELKSLESPGSGRNLREGTSSFVVCASQEPVTQVSLWAAPDKLTSKLYPPALILSNSELIMQSSD